MNTNETTALAVTDNDRWTRDDLVALKETLGKDLTVAEFKVFIAAAKRLELDPFARQIYGIKQQGRMVIQVSIDGFRLIAERTGKYAGQLGPFWCGADGVWQEVWLASTPPVAARVGVLRRDFAEPMWGVARTAAYSKGNSPTWSNLPDVMIAKVAESLALRRAFPAELSGVYTHEEMAQADSSQQSLPEPPRKRETPRTSEPVSEVVDAETDTPAPSHKQTTQATPAEMARRSGYPGVTPTTPTDPMDATVASADEQTRLAEKLRAAGYGRDGANALLASVTKRADDRALDVGDLVLGASNLTLRELATITQRLTRQQANGKAGAK